MIKPTVGRVVLFYPAGVVHTADPCAAIVAKVWSDTMVNLAVFDANGVARGETSVLLVQDDGYGNPAGGSWCCWMPYQKGQAAKTEALERSAQDFPDKQP